MTISVSLFNLHIQDSFRVSKWQFAGILNGCKLSYPNCEPCVHRSTFNMMLEWATHNLLYFLHIKRSSTKHVDLNYPQKWYERIGYAVFGVLALVLIK